MPSFTIEAEGEVVPLSAQEVYKVLLSTSASGVNQQTLKTATQQLTNWERTSGYYSFLQDLYSNFALADEIRFQAIIQLKNGIDKHWRKTSTHAVSKDEKMKIRSQAITVGVQEPLKVLALQNSLVLAKIIRYEFPHDWPDAISILIQHLRAANSPQVESINIANILQLTLQTIKELASGRLQRTKKSLESVAPELLDVLGQLYISVVQKWSASTFVVEQDLINSYSALKALRRVLIAGFEHPHRERLVKHYWDIIQQHHQIIDTRWRGSSLEETSEANILMKHLLQYYKLYLEMARSHPASFVLLGCMNILKNLWEVISGIDAKNALAGNLEWSVQRHGDNVHGTSAIQKLALKALLLFRACVKMVFNPVQTFKYQYPADKEDRIAAVAQVRDAVFTDEFIVQFMEILVTQYFVLRPEDLREWEEEPDEWEKREEEIADAWEFSLRSCSEKLFLDLVINFRGLLVPRLLQVFERFANTENHDVLLKDSLYTAVGTAAACIEDILDFNTLIRNVLVAEVQLNRPHYNLIRRRIAILLGQWVPIKPESLDRPAIYSIFTHLLSTDDPLNDHVVRVTAGRQLRLVLEPFEFSAEDFEPYATMILQGLMGLITETELSETKMALLETVRVIVTKLEDRIEPYASAIMSILPSLWTESGEEHLMKQAILTMITAIVTSLGQKGVDFHPPVLPLIHDAVQIDSEAIVYLLEEALELWAAILQQSPSVSPPPSAQLIALKQDLLPLLETGSEHLRQCFEIIESYTVLIPTAVLDQSFLLPLTTSLTGLLDMLSQSTRARDPSLALHVVENLVSTISTPSYFQNPLDSQAIDYLVSTMIDTGYFGKLFGILKEAYDYHRDPRPNRRPPGVVGIAETGIFTLLARFAVVAPNALLRAITATGNSLDWVVSEWISQFDSIGDTLRKKLQVLGLTNLMKCNTSPPQILLESFESLINIWTDLIVELSEGAADENQGDYLWSGPSAATSDWPGEAPEDSRKRVIANNDPIYAFNIQAFVKESLQQCIDSCGGSESFEQQWLTRVDPAVLKSFGDLKLL